MSTPVHVLREYALLADGERGVLVGPSGDFAWMCVPQWDHGSVFSSLIGGHGIYQVTPRGRFVWGGYYEEGSLIWRSRWVTNDGVAECREALAFPGDAQEAVLLRRLEVLDGDVGFDVVLRPRADYDRSPLRALHNSEGVWTGRVGDLRVRWSGAPAATDEPDGHGGRQLVTGTSLHAGDQLDLVLEISTGELDGPVPHAESSWTATVRAWSEQVPPPAVSSADRDAHHAVAVLRGLTSASGAMVAATTASLPERAESGRNYDYRYAWIRDQCYTGVAAARAGAWSLLDDAVRFVSSRLLDDGPTLAPAYTVREGRVPDQSTLDLPGYPGGAATLGNHVNAQFQLDAYGEALNLLATADDHGRLDDAGRRAASVAAEAVESRWQEPGAGVWELDDRRWTHSRLSCIAGLRAVVRSSTQRDVGRWTALADAILADLGTTSVHPSGRWQRADDDAGVDSSLLLGALRGATTVDDPRARRTFDAVLADLCRGEYAYRFRPDGRPLGEAEGAFLLCGFWVALAFHQRNDHLSAARWFERSRSACGPPGLLSEEFDVRERQMRGNLPQAFVHALLLECAATLELGITPRL